MLRVYRDGRAALQSTRDYQIAAALGGGFRENSWPLKPFLINLLRQQDFMNVLKQ